MAKYEPPTVREWLQAMLVFRGRDADRAKEILDLLDSANGTIAGREEMGDGAYELLVFHGLCIGDDPTPFLEAVLARDKATRELAVEAGLLGAQDRTTDPLPLLRMFLPV